jgi:hypothetical protein
MINNMLRNPAPTPPTPTSTDSTSAMNATALVGVASTFEAPSIKIYKTRQKYNEWEFVFEVRSNAPAGQGTTDPLANPNQSGSGSPNSSPSSPNPFGTGQPNSNPNPLGSQQNSNQSNSTFNPG